MILGVSFDTIDEQRGFRETCAFPYSLLSDADKQLAIACGAADDSDQSHANRITVVIGADQRVRRTYTNVKPAVHAQQVLTDLDT